PGEGERKVKTPFSTHKKGITLSSLLPPDPHPLSSLFPQKLLVGEMDTVGTSDFPRQARGIMPLLAGGRHNAAFSGRAA
ncbi:MAG: hypothetical protein AB7E47_11430, partial [Desulfovibrionaceae bacterium]